MASSPKIVLYTNHGCPWAHRAHIALEELGLPFEEEIIDLSVPRTPEYLKVNPRGLVPSLSYNGNIITESGIVARFLADAHQSHLVPASTSKEGALRRARVDFFADTYTSKANPFYFKAFGAKSDEEVEAAAEGFVAAVVKEVEPLLADAAPFYGGSDRITLAEVLTASFVLRIFALTKHGVFPQSFTQSLPEKAPNFYKWSQAVIKHPSVLSIWKEEAAIQRTKERIAKARAQ